MTDDTETREERYRRENAEGARKSGEENARDWFERQRREERRKGNGRDENRLHVVEPPGEPMPNARRFVDHEYHHLERDLLIFQGGVFYRWDGTCWPELDDHELRSRLYQHFRDALYLKGKGLEPYAPNRYKVADLVDALRAVAHIPTSTPTPSWLRGGEHPANEYVSCRNGLLHVPTRALCEHTPTFYAHHSVSFDFGPAAKPDRWLSFLNDLWGEDQETIETLQEMIGYLISGDTTQQKMFMIVGSKRSGKGTIARVIKALLGEHNVAGPTLAGLGTNFGLSPLIAAPVAIIADARLRSSDTSIVTERLLSISGEDTLTIDRKYKDPWTGQIPARLLLVSNELPRMSDSSGALASRFIIMLTTKSFYGKENPRLTDELCTELPAILNWALDGLQRLRERGYFRQPEASQSAMRDLEDLSSPVGAFVRDECKIGPDCRVPCDTLYQAWKQWCEDHGHQAGSTQLFGRNLAAAFPQIRTVRPEDSTGKRFRAYNCIALRR